MKPNYNNDTPPKEKNVIAVSLEGKDNVHRENEEKFVSFSQSLKNIIKQIGKEKFSEDYSPTHLSISSELLRREHALRRLSCSITRRTIVQINLSQCSLVASDAHLLYLALIHNPSLAVLKLGYNNLGDNGICIIAEAISGHSCLSILDVGFNNVGDTGCLALVSDVLAGNPIIQSLYLSGNSVGEKGAIALAEAVRLEGCGLKCLHLAGNRIGPNGARELMRAIKNNEERRQACQQSATGSSYNRNYYSNVNKKRRSKRSSNASGLQKLYLGNTEMKLEGCLSLSNMLITNLSIRVLSLSNLKIGDYGIAQFAQSVARNKLLPLEVLQLSFNHITCAGVKNLVHAIGGSTTLRELRLDNNNVQDHGARVLALAIPLMKLEVLDLGFNKISTKGIKALMKSVAENNSLHLLMISGNRIDDIAATYVSYALAHNTSLRKVYLDRCFMSHSTLRLLTAGIVSNSLLALNVVTGFNLGVILTTLGFPPELKDWCNYNLLQFIQLMWKMWQRLHKAKDVINKATIPNTSLPNEVDGEVLETENCDSNNSTFDDDGIQSKYIVKDASTVIKAAKVTFKIINGNLNEMLILISTAQWNEKDFEQCQNESPFAPPAEAMILEKTPLGKIQELRYSTGGCAYGNSATPNCSDEEGNLTNYDRKKWIMENLKEHVEALVGVAHEPFINDNLWTLYQHFYSPVYNRVPLQSHLRKVPALREMTGIEMDSTYSIVNTTTNSLNGTNTFPLSHTPALRRNFSYSALSETKYNGNEKMSGNNYISWNGRGVLNVDNLSAGPASRELPIQSMSRRIKGGRVYYYPPVKHLAELDPSATISSKKSIAEKVREKLETLKSKSQGEILTLMRQLKYLEIVLFMPYVVTKSDLVTNFEALSLSDVSLHYRISKSDVEDILLDLL